MIPDLVERAYEFYQQLVPPVHEPAERMPVYLLATRNQWATATAHLTGARAEIFLRVRNGGFSDGGVSVIQYVEPSITGPLLAHEGFHQYLHCCVGPAVPAWLNEGLAVVCEGQRWTATRLREFDPHFNPTRQSRLAEAVNRDRLFPLEELLRTHAGNVVQGTSTQVGSITLSSGRDAVSQEGEDGKLRGGFRTFAARVRRRPRPTVAGRANLAEDGQSTPARPCSALHLRRFATFDARVRAYLQIESARLIEVARRGMLGGCHVGCHAQAAWRRGHVFARRPNFPGVTVGKWECGNVGKCRPGPSHVRCGAPAR